MRVRVRVRVSLGLGLESLTPLIMPWSFWWPAPILMLSRDPQWPITSFAYTEHCHFKDFKGFRNCVPGAGVKDQIFSFYCITPSFPSRFIFYITIAPCQNQEIDIGSTVNSVSHCFFKKPRKTKEWKPFKRVWVIGKLCRVGWIFRKPSAGCLF